MSPAKSKKTVGVIGLGIMGGSFSRNLVAAGWRVVGFDIDAAKRKELAKAGVEIVGSAKAVAAAAPIIITSLPKPEALIGHREGNRRSKAAAPDHRRMLDLHDRGQGEGREDAPRRRPRHARLPGERHRLAGADRRPGDLRQRRSQIRGQGQAGVRRLLAQAVRRRRLRQRQPDEIRRQPPGRDQQRRLGRSHGDGHEGRPRSESRSSR